MRQSPKASNTVNVFGMMRLTRALLTGVAGVALVLAPVAVPAAYADPVVPRHAVVTCQTASFYTNYDSARGPVGLKRVLTNGNKIGHTPRLQRLGGVLRLRPERLGLLADRVHRRVRLVVRRLVTMAVVGALASSALPAAPASAANGRIGVRETVCAQDLFVRTQPNGAWMGTLFRGQTFLVEGPRSGGYIFGFAYGHINRRGWVQDGWFC